MASFLVSALGKHVVMPFVFSAPSKSKLAYGLLGAVNAGRLKLYRNDGSPECREFWRQMEQARYAVGANKTMDFYVPPDRGHDDFLMPIPEYHRVLRSYLDRVAAEKVSP